MAGVKPVKAGWWNAFRPWTLHGAVVPVIIGGAVAYVHQPFGTLEWILFALVLAGGLLLQSASNLLNTYGDFSKLAACNVVLNASGVGMGKTIGQTPLPKEYLQPSQFCFDACYNLDKTRFLLDAEEKGCRILNGLGMSLYQGVAQVELWSGKKAPAEAMRQELLRILEEPSE